MRPQIVHSTYPSGGGQLKLSGKLTVQQSPLIRDSLLEILNSNGNYLLSLRDAEEMDLSMVQLLWSLRHAFKTAGRRLTITWPQQESLSQLLSKTGLLQALKK